MDDDVLLQSWEIQQEGVNDESSSESQEDLDLYGRPKNPTDKEEAKKASLSDLLRDADSRSKLIFHRWVLLLSCLSAPILCAVTVLLALRERAKCSTECIFTLHGSGRWVVPMMALLVVDLAFLVIGAVHHLRAKGRCCCKRWRYLNDTDLRSEGVADPEPVEVEIEEEDITDMMDYH